MTTRCYRLLAGLLFGTALTCGFAQAQTQTPLRALPASVSAPERELPVVTGTNWIATSDNEKKAFLLGIGTVLMLAQAWYGDNPPSPEQSFIPTMIDGLDTLTLTEVLAWIDAWYAAHPDQLERPVMELVWSELVLPNLSKPQ